MMFFSTKNIQIVDTRQPGISPKFVFTIHQCGCTSFRQFEGPRLPEFVQALKFTVFILAVDARAYSPLSGIFVQYFCMSI